MGRHFHYIDIERILLAQQAFATGLRDGRPHRWLAELDGTEHLNEFYVREVLSSDTPNPMIALVSRYSSKP